MLAAQPVAGSLHHWRHVLCKRLRAWWLLPLACVLTSCADDSAQQQQAQALLRHGVASDIRHNTLMDAAFGTENELIVPGEVYWQAVLPLPQLLPAGAVQAVAAASATAANSKGKAAARQAASSNEALSKVLNKAGKQGAPDGSPVLATGAIHQQLVAVRPREAVRLNDDQVALLVESFPASQRPQPDSAAGASATAVVPAHIGVIFFQADAQATPASAAGKSSKASKAETGAGQWRAVRLVPHVEALLTGPTLPDVQVYRLDASRYLVTYTQTACQAGACSRWLKGYLLQPEAMRPVLSIRLASSNAEQWADCPARLGLMRADPALSANVRQLHAQQPPAAGASSAARPTGAGAAAAAYPPAHLPSRPAASVPTPAHSCHAVLGEVHLISRGGADAADVQIRYSGAVSDAPGRLRPIAQAQRFRLQGDQLVQIDGTASPVPEQS